MHAGTHTHTHTHACTHTTHIKSKWYNSRKMHVVSNEIHAFYVNPQCTHPHTVLSLNHKSKFYLEFLFYWSPKTSDFCVQSWSELVVELMEVPQQVEQMVCKEMNNMQSHCPKCLDAFSITAHSNISFPFT